MEAVVVWTMSVGFLALIIWGVVVSLRRRRAVREAKDGHDSRSHLKGVGGWLKFFIFAISVPSPVRAALETWDELHKAEVATPAIINAPVWTDYRVGSYLLVVGFTLWSWFVAYRLCTRFERNTVVHVRAFIVFAPFCLVLGDWLLTYYLFGVNAWAEQAPSMNGAVLPIVVWLLYFWNSDRVRNTYLTPTTAASTSGQVQPT